MVAANQGCADTCAFNEVHRSAFVLHDVMVPSSSDGMYRYDRRSLTWRSSAV